ncbi:hypothetical protein HK100_007292 [Physocladia obscura]|uniref:Uncharacterized protein n=1 Tax=Physocladia obscura TaxID=109957 RepID=A0AAD5X8C5_9FUNG|nr:hypothetical protein HK100_007292 [Physocladia obscura]
MAEQNKHGDNENNERDTAVSINIQDATEHRISDENTKKLDDTSKPSSHSLSASDHSSLFKSWKKPTLLRRDDMPEWYQKEMFIWTGYRPITDSTKDCIYSLVFLHNESGNIYTHLLGALLFVCLMGYTWGHLMFENKFTGVDWRDHLIAFEMHLSAVVFANITPTLMKPEYGKFRLILFIGFGFFSVIPIAHSFIINGVAFTQRAMGLNYLLLIIISNVGGSVIFHLRVPEKYSPGSFDFFGQSHQIMHTAVVLGAVFHYLGFLEAFSFWHSQNGDCLIPIGDMILDNSGGWGIVNF